MVTAENQIKKSRAHRVHDVVLCKCHVARQRQTERVSERARE